MKRKCILSVALIGLFSLHLHAEKVSPAQLHGRWLLKYRGNYGYMMHFYKNFRALCVIYLNQSAVVFKGIYTVEADDTLRINIYEMKNTGSGNINYYTHFIKTTSTFFLFNVRRVDSGTASCLEIKPRKIIIDGRSSDGYFEPLIKLKKY